MKRIFNPPKGHSYFLFGPRGTGKSTWATHFYPRALRIDLLDDGVYRSYSAEPSRLLGVVRACPPGQTVIIDEIQKVPQLLSLVHLLIEEKKGWTFVLTGSSARKLKRSGVDLLGGRALRCEMHPFMGVELGDRFSLKNALRHGMLPLLWVASEPERALDAYAGLYLREEVQQEGLVRQVGHFSRFLETMAFSHGAQINFSNIARETEANRNTVVAYAGILEDLLLSFTLSLFTKRARRELAGHPKFYYFDPGVFRALRRKGPFDRAEEIEGQALEGLVAQHLRAWNSYGDGKHEIGYWRTRWGVEVDFVVYGPTGLWAIEVKNSIRHRREDEDGLRAFLEDYPTARGVLLHRGQERFRNGRVMTIPCESFLRALRPGSDIGEAVSSSQVFTDG